MTGGGFRTFVAGEVLSAATVQDFLMDQAVMNFSGTAARGSALPSPSAGMVAHIGGGTLSVYGTAWANFAPTAAQNIVQTTKTDTFQTTSATFTDITGLSVTITPSSTSSRVLVMADVSAHPGTLQGGGNRSGGMALLRGSTILLQGDTAGVRTRSTFASDGGPTNGGPTTAGFVFLDSPASTSALTYKVQIAAGTATTTVSVNRGDLDNDVSISQRTTSHITVWEIR